MQYKAKKEDNMYFLSSFVLDAKFPFCTDNVLCSTSMQASLHHSHVYMCTPIVLHIILEKTYKDSTLILHYFHKNDGKTELLNLTRKI